MHEFSESLKKFPYVMLLTAIISGFLFNYLCNSPCFLNLGIDFCLLKNLSQLKLCKVSNAENLQNRKQTVLIEIFLKR